MKNKDRRVYVANYLQGHCHCSETIGVLDGDVMMSEMLIIEAGAKMQPSQMTDDQLQLAIVEIIAKENNWELHPAKPEGSDCWITGTGIKFVPNYPGDNNAVQNSLMEPMRKKGFSFWLCASESGYFAIFWRPEGDKGMLAIPTSDGICDNAARAICEAWLKARRNDG